MRPADILEVRELPLFRACSEETFDLLVHASFLQRFPRGTTLIQEHDRADFLYVVVEGLIEMFASNAGRETTIELVHPVRSFILAAVLRDQQYLQSARTLESARLLMIPAESVRSAMHRDVGFMSAIVAELSTCYRTLVKELKNQKLRSGADRLANWLIRADRQQGAGGVVRIEVEKRIVASHLGMSPENLSRAFASLAAHGVELDGSTVHLRDPERLSRRARPNALIDDEAT